MIDFKKIEEENTTKVQDGKAVKEFIDWINEQVDVLIKTTEGALKKMADENTGLQPKIEEALGVKVGRNGDDFRSARTLTFNITVPLLSVFISESLSKESYIMFQEGSDVECWDIQLDFLAHPSKNTSKTWNNSQMGSKLRSQSLMTVNDYVFNNLILNAVTENLYIREPQLLDGEWKTVFVKRGVDKACEEIFTNLGFKVLKTEPEFDYPFRGTVNSNLFVIHLTVENPYFRD